MESKFRLTEKFSINRPGFYTKISPGPLRVFRHLVRSHRGQLRTVQIHRIEPLNAVTIGLEQDALAFQLRRRVVSRVVCEPAQLLRSQVQAINLGVAISTAHENQGLTVSGGRRVPALAFGHQHLLAAIDQTLDDGRAIAADQ